MPPQALLFDFDGVIADTENIHIAAWERTFGLMGWDVPIELCRDRPRRTTGHFSRKSSPIGESGTATSTAGSVASRS